MTEVLMMTLTPQLCKIAIKKKASHASSIREPDIDFRNYYEIRRNRKIKITMRK